jgi:hypothetical protein
VVLFNPQLATVTVSANSLTYNDINDNLHQDPVESEESKDQPEVEETDEDYPSPQEDETPPAQNQPSLAIKQIDLKYKYIKLEERKENNDSIK